jgi:hypothetical protein
MALPVISYQPGQAPITLAFQRGPQGFVCRARGVRNRNVATSGAVETVEERVEFLLSFTMPLLVVGGGGSDDVFEAWATWFHWALGGGSFVFYPHSGDSQTYWNCTLESDEWAPAYLGPRGYSLAVELRIIPDEYAPDDAGEVYAAMFGS